jgi:hypothetical protein
MNKALIATTLALLSITLASCGSEGESTKDASAASDSSSAQDVSERDLPVTPAVDTADGGNALDVSLDAGIDAVKLTSLDGPSGTGVEGGSQLKVLLRKGSAYANCMPSISPDPIIATWTVEISGARGTTARLTQATVTVADKTNIVQELTVDNPTLALENGAVTADQRKPLTQQLPNTACESMCGGGAAYQLDLVYEVDGQRIPVSKAGVFSCAY